MKKGKLVSLLGIALTSTIVLAACGGGSGSDKASDSASKDSSGKMAKKTRAKLN
ncbi:exported hypothetical protein [Carnobacterium maltaromaticum]|nr:exported hypothetical protein [Carnobacterium maltaromaticum]